MVPSSSISRSPLLNRHRQLVAGGAIARDMRYGASDTTVDQYSLRGPEEPASATFRLYKRRWAGLAAVTLLNMVSGMSLAWFGPIATSVSADFGFTIDQVNWLSNVINLTYIVFSPVVPYLYSRFGLRRSCYIGGAFFVVSAWIRYAGTASSLSSGGALALIMIGQLIAGLAQPLFQVLIPSFSEKWFDLQTRITATMIMSLGNPVGNAIGQLLSPLVGNPRQSILVLAIIFTCATPLVFLVGNAPPTPPTHSGATSPPFMPFIRALFGKESEGSPAYTTPRQRLDFLIIFLVFGVLVSVINVFSILSAQIMEPYGYSDDESGLMGATLLLTGLIAAGVTSPLFDRYFSKRLAISAKCLCPVIASGWVGLIWAVREDDAVGLFAIFALIGAASLTLLPVAVELAVEVTKNADGSSAVLWCSSNIFALIFILTEGSLRANSTASPPYNMRRALIFQACWVVTVVVLVQFLQGRQTRREADEQAAASTALLLAEDSEERTSVDSGSVSSVQFEGVENGFDLQAEPYHDVMDD